MEQGSERERCERRQKNVCSKNRKERERWEKMKEDGRMERQKDGIKVD